MSGRLRALVILAVALLRSLAARLSGREMGMKRFLENYAPDRLPPVSPDERDELPAQSRCIACGLCDEGEGPRMAASRGAYPGLMQLVLASSRSMPDHDAAAKGFSHVPDEVLAEKETICPTRVPLRTLASFVRKKAALVAE